MPFLQSPCHRLNYKNLNGLRDPLGKGRNCESVDVDSGLPTRKVGFQ